MKAKKEKFYTVHMDTKDCRFYLIPGYLVAMAEVGGAEYCAFFPVFSIRKKASGKTSAA